MRERAAGRIVSCRVNQLASTAGLTGAGYVPVVYDIHLDVQVGEAVVSVDRFQAVAPRSAVGDRVEVEWQNGTLARIVNSSTGEVLLDKREDVRILVIAALIALALVVGAVFLAVGT